MFAVTQTNNFFVQIVFPGSLSIPNTPSLGVYSGSAYWAYGDTVTIGEGETAITYVGGILSAMDSVSRSVDISETGGFNSDSSFSCSIQNSLFFEQFISMYGIKFVGLTMRALFLLDSEVVVLWTGRISAWSTSETEINISGNVEAIMPSGNIQSAVIDVETYPNAAVENNGAPMPIVFGDVEYSPTVSISSDNKPYEFGLSKTYAIQIGDFSEASGFCTMFIPYAMIYTDHDGFLEFYKIWGNIATNDLALVFTSGTDSPQYAFRAKINAMPAFEGDIQFSVYGNLNDTGASITSAHGWPASLPTSTERFEAIWWYQLVPFYVNAIASSKQLVGNGPYNIIDAVSKYVDSQKSYTRNYSATVVVDDVGPTKLSVIANMKTTADNQIPVYKATPINADAIVTLKYYEYIRGSAGPYIADFVKTGNTASIRDRDYSVVQENTIPAGITLDTNYFGMSIHIENIDVTSIVQSDTPVYLAIDWTCSTGVSILVNFAGIHCTTTYGDTEIIYVASLSSTIQREKISYVPRDYYTNKEFDEFYNLKDDSFAESAFFNIPDTVTSKLRDGTYTAISIQFNGPWHGQDDYGRIQRTHAIDATVNIHGIAIVTNVSDDDQKTGWYYSTEGETLGNDGTTKTDTVSSALAHSLIDYAGLSYIEPEASEEVLRHIGRTIVEETTTQEVIGSLCKQSFVSGFIGRYGWPVFRSWISRRTDTPVFSFDESNIIRDSIEGWCTTPTSRCYNSFIAAYDFDYETDKYKKFMSINNASGTFPAVDGAWDKFVSGIGSGADAAAYAEALEAWTNASEGYAETGALRAYSKSNGELSWFVNPSWVGTAVEKYELSSWKWLKNAAYWLSAPRREVRFSVSLEYAGIELIDLCTFSDAIFTAGVPLTGWVTSIQIERDRINIGMSMDRKTTQKAAIREVGIQTIPVDTVTERGIQTVADDTITETGI